MAAVTHRCRHHVVVDTMIYIHLVLPRAHYSHRVQIGVIRRVWTFDLVVAPYLDDDEAEVSASATIVLARLLAS